MSFSVSVVVPVFNRRDFLQRSLSSVLGQSRLANEVIVVDDGSTDGSGVFVREQFPQVKVIRQENLGVSAARNAGIRAAQSQWVAFLDSDDEWLPGKLEVQLAALKAESEFRFCHGEDVWVRRGVRVNAPKHYAKPRGWCFQDCLERCVVSPSASLIHREVFDAVGLFDESLPACEDYDLWLRIAARFPLLLVDEAVLVKYDGHEGQLSDQRGLDRFRIEALAKVILSGVLGDDDVRAAVAVFERKCGIFVKGAEKHGNLLGADEVGGLLEMVREGIF